MNRLKPLVNAMGKELCSVHTKTKQCQMAAFLHLGSDKCWFHMHNKTKFPRDKGGPVVKRGKLSAKEKNELREAQGNVCCICGVRFHGDVDVMADHLFCWSKGGENNEENWGLAHVRCNFAKFDSLLEDTEINFRLAKIRKHFRGGEIVDFKLSPSEEAKLLRLYEQHGKSVKLGGMFGISSMTVLKIVRRNKGRVKERGESKRHFTNKEVAALAKRYKAGSTIVSLGYANQTSPQCVYRHLIRYDPDIIRPMNAHKKKTTLEQELEICRLYKETPASAVYIGILYELCERTVLKILEKHGIPRTKFLIDEDLKDAVCRDYQKGRTQEQCGDIHNISFQKVSYILKQRGIPTRGNRIFTQEEERKICAERAAGKSVNYLFKKYGRCSLRTFRYILKRNGIKTRPDQRKSKSK